MNKSIGEVMRWLNERGYLVTTHQISQWEKIGLCSFARSNNRYREFGFLEIQRIQQIYILYLLGFSTEEILERFAYEAAFGHKVDDKADDRARKIIRILRDFLPV